MLASNTAINKLTFSPSRYIEDPEIQIGISGPFFYKMLITIGKEIITY